MVRESFNLESFLKRDREKEVMYKFAGLIDKLVILISCSIVYFCQGDLEVYVVPVLVGVIFSGFLSYFDDDRIRTAMTVGYSILSLFFPGLIFFMPLIAYDMFFYKYQYFNVFAVIPLGYSIRHVSIQTLLMVSVLLFFCILVRYRAEAQFKLQARYNELRDTTREMSIKLEKQNKDLMEKQDYELNLAMLNERNRIAREIHDNVGHLLSSAILQSGALITINKDEMLKAHLHTLNDTLTRAMNSIRSSIHKLYEESIDLNAEIEKLVRQFTFCQLNYDYQIYSDPGIKLKYAFISIIKEALSNIIKHSNADHASIAVREHPAFYQLIVQDNGKVKNYNIDNGIGLKNMIDRVHSLNGNINITTEGGFKIFIIVPKGELES